MYSTYSNSYTVLIFIYLQCFWNFNPIHAGGQILPLFWSTIHNFFFPTQSLWNFVTFNIILFCTFVQIFSPIPSAVEKLLAISQDHLLKSLRNPYKFVKNENINIFWSISHICLKLTSDHYNIKLFQLNPFLWRHHAMTSSYDVIDKFFNF